MTYTVTAIPKNIDHPGVCPGCRPHVLALSERLWAAADVLRQRAEKDGQTKLIMELRLSLERIADGRVDAVVEARKALGWS
jgi:hypothetical protein